MISRIKDLPYTERLKALSYRRKRGDLIMCYKVMTNKVRLNKEKFFTLNNNKTREHVYKLHKHQRAIKQSRSQSFAIRFGIGIACHQTLIRRNQPTTLNASWISTGKVNDSNHLICRNWKFIGVGLYRQCPSFCRNISVICYLLGKYQLPPIQLFADNVSCYYEHISIFCSSLFTVHFSLT